MPTKKPRIQVSLETSEYELVKRLAKLQDRSMSQVLSDLFAEIAPVYERVAVVLQAAKRAQTSAHQGFREAAQKAEAEIAPHVAAAIGQFDIFEQALGVTGGSGLAASERSEARPSAPPRTPGPVTRGSGIPGKPTRTARPPPTISRRLLRKPRKKQRIGGTVAAPGRRAR